MLFGLIRFLRALRSPEPSIHLSSLEVAYDVAMLLNVVRVYEHGRKLSEKELRSAEGVTGCVRTHTVTINGKDICQAYCMGGSTEILPPLFEPQLPA
jgi:hypothetical protein